MMGKVKEFVVKHRTTATFIVLALFCVIGAGVNLYNQHQKQVKFEREHPLVGQVYKFEYREKPADGGISKGTDYYVFGNEKYRNKVIVYSKYTGGLNGAKKILHSAKAYNRAFSKGWADNYRVVDGNKLVIGGDASELHDYQVKKGKNWVGMYDSDEGNEEAPGEYHKLSPINLK